MGRGSGTDARPEVTVLIDTSAWIEYFRGTKSELTDAVQELGAPGAEFRTCGPVTMELFAGARDPAALDTISGILGWGSDIPCNTNAFEDAAALYRLCREAGFSIRSIVDCLIASLALSQDAVLLHNDRDFNAISRVVPLRIHPASLGSS